MTSLPAISLVSMPGRHKAALDLAVEIEQRGFAGVFIPSLGDVVGLCHGLALRTERLVFGPSIANIYTRHVTDWAMTAGSLHEMSNGRFRFGIGVSHAPFNDALGVSTGKPLADTRTFVEGLRSARAGEQPPIVLAAMRDKMVALAAEIGDGMVFANAALSACAGTLGRMPEVDDDFFIGAMIPTCISDDVEAAAAVNRKTLVMYCGLPNYRNYWKSVGYEAEMVAIEAALAAGDRKAVPGLMTDAWLDDVTLFGPAEKVRERADAWFEAGMRTPILVPSSVEGGQFKAIEELFALYE